MGNPFPTQQPPRRLERSRSNRVIGGVCGGLADYANMDPTLVRVLTVVISLFTGVPVILYLIALFALPEEGSAGPDYPPVQGPQGYQNHPGAQGYGFGQDATNPAPSPQAAPRPPYGSGDVWGAQGAPWEQQTPPANPTDQGRAPGSNEPR